MSSIYNLFSNECLSRADRAKAVEILVKDLKVFASFNEELYKEITQLLTLDNFRCLLVIYNRFLFLKL
jgi:hypothetical protein